MQYSNRYAEQKYRFIEGKILTMKIFESLITFIKSLRYTFRRTTIKAVHDDDLPRLLDSLGLLTPIDRGEMKCMFCDNIITTENLSAILSRGRSIHLICCSPECISGFE
jgi:hypothetical protein